MGEIYCSVPACATVRSFAFQLRKEAPKATSRLPRTLFFLPKRIPVYGAFQSMAHSSLWRIPVYGTSEVRKEQDSSEQRRLRFVFIEDLETHSA